MFRIESDSKFSNIFFLSILLGLTCFASEQGTNKAPKCLILSPSNESSFTCPAKVIVSIKGEDADGKIDTLKILSNKTTIGITTHDEFSMTFDDIGTGVYIFQAIAIDDKGTLSDTAEIKFFITTPQGYSYKEIRISQSSDDAEESFYENRVFLKNKNLDLTVNKSTKVNQVVGLRFKNAGIPHKALINYAFIKFTSGDTTDEGSVLGITGHLSNNSKTFSDSSADISFRPSTNSSVSWNPYPWDRVNKSGYIHQTPNLRKIIQEIVNQESFNKNSSFTLLIRGDCTNTAKSYDGDPLNAPKLIIEYKTDTLITGMKEINEEDTIEVKDGNSSPVAKFSFTPTEGRIPLNITYNANLSTDPEGDSLEYCWDFGDGTVSTEMEGTHIYKDIGVYSVILVVSDPMNISDTASIKIYATNNNTTPKAKIIAKPEIGVVPFKIVYDAVNSFDPEGNELQYYWDFDDGITSNEKSGEHKYIVSKNYNLMLIISDGENYDTAYTDIIAKPEMNRNPIVICTIDTISGKPFTRLFDASNSSDPDGDALQYIWSFGDGVISSEKVVEHTYKNNGSYNVILTILDENNNSTIKEISLKIEDSVENILPSNVSIEPTREAQFVSPTNAEKKAIQ